jgi:deazaflavin-dependent oxidoreductase (nitroreductase family)
MSDLVTRVAQRVLGIRWLVRAPIGLYRAGFGWLLGHRVLMLEHLGRVSHERRFVVVEVVDRSRNRLLIVSGFGHHAQWYRNLEANGVAFVSIGAARRVPAKVRLLDEAESEAAIEDYARRHPLAYRVLGPVLTRLTDEPVPPMVELTRPDDWTPRSQSSRTSARSYAATTSSWS